MKFGAAGQDEEVEEYPKYLRDTVGPSIVFARRLY
jgi:hypothetical protein